MKERLRSLCEGHSWNVSCSNEGEEVSVKLQSYNVSFAESDFELQRKLYKAREFGSFVTHATSMGAFFRHLALLSCWLSPARVLRSVLPDAQVSFNFETSFRVALPEPKSLCLAEGDSPGGQTP